MDPISEAVDRGMRSVTASAISERVHCRTQNIFEAAVREFESSVDQSRYEGIAESYGAALKISQIYSFEQNIALCHFRIAELLRTFTWEDVDITKTEAAIRFFETAEIDDRIGMIRERAISLTNSALCLIEKHRPTNTDLEAAKVRLTTAMALREPYSEDWAFSKFNLGIYWSTIGAVGEARLQNFTKARNYIRGAITIFGEKASEHLAVALGELARIEDRLVSTKTEVAVLRAVSTNREQLPPNTHHTAAVDPVGLGFVLYSNPQTMGLDSTPPWITDAVESQPDESSVSDISDLLTQFAVLGVAIDGLDARAAGSARWYRAKLAWLLSPNEANYEALEGALADLTAESDHELFFIRGMQLVRASRAAPGARLQSQVLLNLSSAYQKITAKRSRTRLEIFLRNHPAEIRFVACELCERGEVEAAFDLLDSTRSLLFSKESRTEQPVAAELAGFVGANWVYVTHSPTATYVIGRGTCDGRIETSAEIVREVAGARLAQLTSSIASGREGLLIAQNPQLPKSALARSTTEMLNELRPVAEAIESVRSSLKGTRLVLIPSGLYSVVPVEALSTGADDSNYRDVPKMVAATVRRSIVSVERSLSLAYCLSAPISSGLPELRHSDSEARSIVATLDSIAGLPSVETRLSATVRDMMDGLRAASILHVSSHSGADQLEPTQSAISLSDGRVAVEDILTVDSVNCSLVTLSSCQSGLAGPLVLADEFLSIQSALLHAGCRLTVGTLWPILDIVGLLFFTRFYANLASGGSMHIDFLAAWNALNETRRWMQIAPVSEIVATCDGLGVAWPLGWAHLHEDTKVLSEPSIWAAFYLSGSDVGI